MHIRLFRPGDAVPTSQMIERSLLGICIADYSEAFLGDFAKAQSPEALLSKSAWAHFYVVEQAGKILACGAIGPLQGGKEGEACLYTLFVDPAHKGKGLGKAILHSLEQDAFFLQASRVEVSASLTAHKFYEKMGYAYKDGKKICVDNDHYFMEKFPLREKRRESPCKA